MTREVDPLEEKQDVEVYNHVLSCHEGATYARHRRMIFCMHFCHSKRASQHGQLSRAVWMETLNGKEQTVP